MSYNFLIKVIALFSLKEGFLIETKTFYSSNELLQLLDDLIEEGTYYYLYGEEYLDEVKQYQGISRMLMIDIKKAVKRIEVSKYMKFTLSEKYGKEEIYNLIKILEYKEVFILCIVYNPKISEFCMIFKGSPNDSSLERFINDFLEMESY